MSEPAWQLDKEVDPLTDETVTIASASDGVGASARRAIVRCKGRLEVYFVFGDYLSNDRVSVRYRIDKNPLVEEKWSASTKGTGVFAREPAEVARQLAGGSTFVMEARDFRGHPHRVSFALDGAADAITAVLEQCEVSQQGMEQQVPGLRREIARQLERWGKKNISVNKRVLASLGAYGGPQEVASVEPEFALAVQRFYDDYIARCRDGQRLGINCQSLRIFWERKAEPVMPLVSSVIYERAPGDLREEAGKLKLGD